VAASAIPERVPLGFVCGYPIRTGGELYGGSMFIRSAAADTLQGRAIQDVNIKWGEDFRKWNGRETIGIPVCKKKYAPFVTKSEIVNGRVKIKVERMYGCRCHSETRKDTIKKYGERKGWEPFGQWSLTKAKTMAKKLAVQLENETMEGHRKIHDEENNEKYRQICLNGSCAWKLRGKCDDIVDELSKESDENITKPKKTNKPRR